MSKKVPPGPEGPAAFACSGGRGEDRGEDRGGGRGEDRGGGRGEDRGGDVFDGLHGPARRRIRPVRA